MNFERKLKLNSLGHYKFTEEETKNLELIKSLNIEALNFKIIIDLLLILNLKLIKIIKYDDWLFIVDDHKNMFFEFNISNKKLACDFYTINNILLKNIKFTLPNSNLIQILIEKKFNLIINKISDCDSTFYWVQHDYKQKFLKVNYL